MFRDEPSAGTIEMFQEIARSWARVGLYGGFGGRLKEFDGEPAFEVQRMESGEVVYETILDLGTALGLPVGRVLRTHQWIERDGARLEPLEADARQRVPEARAS